MAVPLDMIIPRPLHQPLADIGAVIERRSDGSARVHIPGVPHFYRFPAAHDPNSVVTAHDATGKAVYPAAWVAERHRVNNLFGNRPDPLDIGNVLYGLIENTRRMNDQKSHRLSLHQWPDRDQNGKWYRRVRVAFAVPIGDYYHHYYHDDGQGIGEDAEPHTSETKALATAALENPAEDTPVAMLLDHLQEHHGVDIRPDLDQPPAEKFARAFAAAVKMV